MDTDRTKDSVEQLEDAELPNPITDETRRWARPAGALSPQGEAPERDKDDGRGSRATYHPDAALGDRLAWRRDDRRRTHSLDQLADDYWDAWLARHPTFATAIGDRDSTTASRTTRRRPTTRGGCRIDEFERRLVGPPTDGDPVTRRRCARLLGWTARSSTRTSGPSTSTR